MPIPKKQVAVIFGGNSICNKEASANFNPFLLKYKKKKERLYLRFFSFYLAKEKCRYNLSVKVAIYLLLI